MPATVAIIGRPNVGKSTLFNRIVGSRIAIESPVAGTTRDPITAFYEGETIDALFVDTGGLEFGKRENQLEQNVQKQARIAIAEADLILFCLDAREEPTAIEREVVELLRKSAGNTPILLVGTKADGKKKVLEASEMLALNIGNEEPIFVAALQGGGLSELLEKIEEVLHKRGFGKREEKPDDAAINIAVIGRPNVGKSSIINALTNSEKLIVSDIAGTTRDAIDTEIKRDEQLFRLIDTAGIRRKNKITQDLEQFAIMRSLKSLYRADVTLFLVDATEGVAHQDKHILDSILEAKTGLIIVINKVDLLPKGEESRNMLLARVRHELDFLPWAPVIFTSAQEKKNLHKLFPLVQEVMQERKKRVSTTKLNNFLQEAQHLHPLTGVRNTRPRIKYGSQVEVSPPHFIFYGTRLNALHFSSRRYLENRLRDVFGFAGTPIILEMTTQENPYHTARKIRLPARERREKRAARKEGKKK